MSKIKACIFDMDGVIVSTEIFHFKAWKRLAETLGFTIDLEFNEKLKGVSRAVCINLILEHGNIQKTQAEKDALAAQKNAWFLEYIGHISPQDVFPGVIDFLNSLKEKKYKIVLGSASKNAPLLLERLEIAHYFDVIIDGNKIQKAKPNPEVFLKGASEVSVVPENCVVFEDALSGVQAARAANMYCIGVGSPELLKNAHFCIQSFTEMSISRFEELV